jgi:hypothetical protein
MQISEELAERYELKCKPLGGVQNRNRFDGISLVVARARLPPHDELVTVSLIVKDLLLYQA